MVGDPVKEQDLSSVDDAEENLKGDSRYARGSSISAAGRKDIRRLDAASSRCGAVPDRARLNSLPFLLHHPPHRPAGADVRAKLPSSPLGPRSDPPRRGRSCSRLDHPCRRWTGIIRDPFGCAPDGLGRRQRRAGR